MVIDCNETANTKFDRTVLSVTELLHTDTQRDVLLLLIVWRRMEISGTDRVRNEEVLRRVMEDRNILHTIKRREAN